MTRNYTRRAALGLTAAAAGALFLYGDDAATDTVSAGRREVLFWHFWGGRDRAVVQKIVDRFNRSQDEHYVRAIAMPGTNLDLKFFLSIAGQDPPDLLNHDDPVLADWAHRGAIMPIDELASPKEYAELTEWLLPTAREIGTYRGRLYAVCNGLDIRALYYNKTLLDSLGIEPPRTLQELDQLAEMIAPPGQRGPRRRFGYLPDPRRLWAWAVVFGGQFYDLETGQLTADGEPVVRALEWMASYSRRYGAEEVSAFRKGDQGLTGAAFPLLEDRYAILMDGQWRVREMAEQAERRPDSTPDYGVVPLPPPPGGREKAGWVNGNFFVVPQESGNPQGAWEFIKFWSGFGGNEADAALACVEGGWIPASGRVVEQQVFQDYLDEHPKFAQFVELAGGENQIPTPSVPGASYLYTEIVRAAEEAMYRNRPPREALEAASRRIRRRLEELSRESP